MKSAGNDIVALNAANMGRACLPAFYSKFITASELKLHGQPALSAMPVAYYNWLLWSVKESAYKYFKRIETSLLFSPIKIIVQDICIQAEWVFPNLTIEETLYGNQQFFRGRVCFEDEQLFFRTTINDGYIASVVNEEPMFNNVFWGIGRVEDKTNIAQSKAVRRLILSKLGAVLNTSNLIIEKDNYSIPQLKKVGTPLNIPLSLAHHHHFIAYSFALNG